MTPNPTQLHPWFQLYCSETIERLREEKFNAAGQVGKRAIGSGELHKGWLNLSEGERRLSDLRANELHKTSIAAVKEAATTLASWRAPPVPTVGDELHLLTRDEYMSYFLFMRARGCRAEYL